MQYHRIPHSSLEVSTLGLGTMTFGEQNSEADAHAQLDYAVAQGINLIDVAEMYPVPPRPETQGLTETYVGNWLAKHGSREKLIIASKVSGPSRNNDKGIRPDQALDHLYREIVSSRGDVAEVCRFYPFQHPGVQKPPDHRRQHRKRGDFFLRQHAGDF